jgi:hypothetical protein
MIPTGREVDPDFERVRAGDVREISNRVVTVVELLDGCGARRIAGDTGRAIELGYLEKADLGLVLLMVG